MSATEFTAMAIAAPTLQLRPHVLTQVKLERALNLSMLRTLTVASLVENAPRVTAAPERVERALAGADGTTYFVPQARIAERSKATGAPHVFLAKSGGVVTLQVWFDLVRFASLPTESQPLPVDNYSVSLIPASGAPIVFERCDDLPRGDQPETVLSRLYCETPVDPNVIVPILETPGTRFRVEGDVHFTVQDGAPADSPPGGIRIRPAGRLRVFDTPARAIRLPDVTSVVAAAPRIRDHRILATPIVRDHRIEAVGVGGAVAPTTPEPTWTSRTTRLSLGAADDSGVAACFPRDVMNNRAIYAQVTSGFGTEPWSAWVDSPHGQFMDSPVPDQFYVLPDEYRIAFDQESKQPAMMVLLVPPKRPEGAEAPTSFGSDYKLRTRFSVVPWIDPARRERLRAEIARHARVAYPDLLIGGIREATCELSTVLHELGSSIVGTEGPTTVDGLGFDLVLDCTSEFYTTLTHLLVTDGVQAQVKATLVSDAESPRVTTVPVTLRLDRPATDVISASLVPPAPPAEAASADDAVAGGEPVTPEATPIPPAPSVLRVSNPLPFAVTVGRTVASLLERDADLPSPIGAVQATAEPSSFQLPAAVDGSPATLDIVLTAPASDQPKIFGSVGVSFEDVAIDIDPEKVLAKAYDTGTSGSVSSAVEVRSYQLEHPETRPAGLADVFGLEVEIRRSSDAAPVTVFLTVDQPKLEVQVSFTLRDIVAGARPEQPTFEWRRRNMSGAGNGEWSEWSTITGRQLFVSPTGM